MFAETSHLTKTLVAVLLLGLVTVGAGGLQAPAGAATAHLAWAGGGPVGQSGPLPANLAAVWQAMPGHPGIEVAHSLHNDTSPPIRDLPPGPQPDRFRRDLERKTPAPVGSKAVSADGAVQAGPGGPLQCRPHRW